MKCIEEVSEGEIFCDLIVDEIDLIDLEERCLEPVTVEIAGIKIHLWLRKANPEENETDIFENFVD